MKKDAWYFDSAAHLEALQNAALPWLGTPFAVHQKCVGAGVDCVNLVGEIMVGAGVVKSYAFPDYHLDHAMRSDRSIITEFLLEHPRFVRFSPQLVPIRAGDIVTFRFGKCVHHCGVAVNGRQFIHAVAKRHVCLARLDDSTWGQRLVEFWRAKR